MTAAATAVTMMIERGHKVDDINKRLALLNQYRNGSVLVTG
jgi:hypothetical protein